MSKERRTVTLDEENDAWLSKQPNASDLINRLVTEVREGGDRATAVLDAQIEQKRRELTEAESRVTRLQRGLDELTELRAELTAEEYAELRQARDALAGTPKDPSNPAIETWAGKLGMTPETLVERLRDESL